jgi:uncharacterized membrane protein
MLIGKILVGIATLAVAVVLIIGLYSLYRGGDFARTNSNKLMRLRVLLQAIAVLVIMLVLFFTSRSGGGGP